MTEHDLIWQIEIPILIAVVTVLLGLITIVGIMYLLDKRDSR